MNGAIEALIQSLSAIPGLGTELGLKHLRNRGDSYIRLLRTFAETRAADATAMRSHLADRDYAELSALMHNVKGVAGFLGATAVRDLATEICAAVRAGRDGAEIERLANEIMAVQLELSEQILTLVGPAPETDGT